MPTTPGSKSQDQTTDCQCLATLEMLETLSRLTMGWLSQPRIMTWISGLGTAPRPEEGEDGGTMDVAWQTSMVRTFQEPPGAMMVFYGTSMEKTTGASNPPE